MSYIVAFVVFSESGKNFPVECYRTDLELGDEVVVRRADGQLRHATIAQIKYLNWECRARIECTRDESTLDADGNVVLPKGSPLLNGMSTSDAFIGALKSKGWVPLKQRQKMYKAVLAHLNTSCVSHIFIRKNGIDVQILPRTNNDLIKPYSLYVGSLTEGKVVRHSLAHTSFNLFEGILRFSNSFINNEAELDRYFVPQGSSDKRSEELKKQAEQRELERRKIKAEIDFYDLGDLGVYPDDMYLGYHMK